MLLADISPSDFEADGRRDAEISRLPTVGVLPAAASTEVAVDHEVRALRRALRAVALHGRRERLEHLRELLGALGLGGGRDEGESLDGFLRHLEIHGATAIGEGIEA